MLVRRQGAGFDDEGGGRLSVDGRGRNGLNCHRPRFFVFQVSTASCEEHFVFWDRGEGEPTGTECQREQREHVEATRARAKERAEWAKVMRRTWRTVAGRHRETHDRRAHHLENTNHRFFFLGFSRGSNTYVTGFSSDGRVVYLSWGASPRHF